MSAKKQQQLRKHKEKRQTIKNGGAPRSPARKRSSDDLSDLGELSGYDEKYNGEGYEGGYSQGTVEATGQV